METKLNWECQSLFSTACVNIPLDDVISTCCYLLFFFIIIEAGPCEHSALPCDSFRWELQLFALQMTSSVG